MNQVRRDRPQALVPRSLSRYPYDYDLERGMRVRMETVCLQGGCPG